MPKTPSPFSRIRNYRQQQGIALYVVIIFVLLSMLLALWAARSALFNEIIVGNDADYQRTFEAAQAMLQDAEFDIRGVKPDGSACTPVDGNIDICRPPPQAAIPASPPTPATPAKAGAKVYFDIETKDLENLLTTIGIQNSTVKCYKGICQKRTGEQDFWNSKSTLDAMTATDVGATYGQFTGATTSNGNDILLNQAWYWVEIMPYIDPNVSLLSVLPPGSNVEKFAPTRKKPWIYRITAFARGKKPGSEVLLQSTLSIQAAE